MQLVRDERHDMNKLWVLRTFRYLFCFVLFCSLPRSFLRLNNRRKYRKIFSHSIFSSQAILLDIFDRDVAWCWARSIRPKIPVWISEIFACRMERYFPPGRTDLFLFPLEHIFHQELLSRQNAEGSWWSGCLKCCNLLRVEEFNTHSEFNSSLILWEKLTNFPRGRVCKPRELTHRKFRTNNPQISRTSDPNVSISI